MYEIFFVSFLVINS